MIIVLQLLQDYLCNLSDEQIRLGYGVKILSSEDDIRFTNICTGENIYLNRRVLNHYLGSNGMCAGNSYEEAVSQGLSEIMERYVLKKLYLDKVSDLDISVIPRKCYEHFGICDLIKKLEKKGFNCKVLNCSLGGRFPVAGFVIFSPNSLRAKFALGCDYDLEIALQRCITELFQGKSSMVELRYFMRNIFELVTDEKSHYFDALRDWQGVIPKALLTERENCDIFPFTQVGTSRQAYKLCVENLSKQHELLVSNASFLGFPTYRVIVRGLSVVATDIDEYQQYCRSISAADRMARQLSEEGRFLFEDFIDFAAIGNSLRYKFSSAHDYFGIVAKQPFSEVGLDEQLAQLCYFQGWYTLAYRYLQGKKGKQDMIRKQIIAAKIYGWDDEQIDDLFYSITSVHNMKTMMDTWAADGLKYFPRCPDCMSCGLRSICAYENYKNIKSILDIAYLKWSFQICWKCYVRKILYMGISQYVKKNVACGQYSSPTIKMLL